MPETIDIEPDLTLMRISIYNESGCFQSVLAEKCPGLSFRTILFQKIPVLHVSIAFTCPALPVAFAITACSSACAIRTFLLKGDRFQLFIRDTRSRCATNTCSMTKGTLGSPVAVVAHS